MMKNGVYILIVNLLRKDSQWFGIFVLLIISIVHVVELTEY